MAKVPGTCVAIEDRGVLLQGPSGAGKSDLALRLIEGGARLVSDDYTEIRRDRGTLLATAPEAIRGLIEVRGIGIVRLDAQDAVPLVAVVELTAAEQVPRMPETESRDILGIALPLFRLAPFEASAPAKVRLAVRHATDGIMRGS
jgi:serine kinase of HPr protein (carbohydrate metabolism regulator)